MSNEQMVSVPRAELVRLQENMEPHRGAVAWGIVCDFLELPAQHQGEPLGWVFTSPPTAEHVESFTRVKDHAEKFEASGWAVIPVYASADAGEVERLHNGHVKSLEALNQQTEKQRDHWMAECDTLRAQLAERDALLCQVIRSGALTSAEHHELEAKCCALSASAEPSAPNCNHAACKSLGEHHPFCDFVQAIEPSAPFDVSSGDAALQDLLTWVESGRDNWALVITAEQLAKIDRQIAALKAVLS